MTVKLYHCKDARSLRPLWTLEEMGLDYELETIPFPPRIRHEGYLEISSLGTVPYMIDGDVEMSESAGISQYLVDTYGPTPLGLKPGDKDYGIYLNWLHRSDATLTFPQTIVLRYGRFEKEERRLPQAVEDYSQWFHARLRCVEDATAEREFLCADRFTIADICVGYALYLAAEFVGLGEGFKPNTRKYYEKIKARPAFQRALEK
ncbi:MAG: glutathione S-transferase family protein [Rhodospirillales bacterium]|nr:glutathione S-transferase family protein [Rhodospirillales bacterium]